MRTPLQVYTLRGRGVSTNRVGCVFNECAKYSEFGAGGSAGVGGMGCDPLRERVEATLGREFQGRIARGTSPLPRLGSSVRVALRAT